jgi:plasmid stability protein
MEAEVRDILRAAVAEPMPPSTALGTRIANRFRGEGLDAPIEEFRNWRVRLPDLEE